MAEGWGWGGGGEGEGPPEVGKQAWRTAEAFGSAGPTLGEPTLPSPPPPASTTSTSNQPGLFLKCGGGKALKALSFMLKASKRRDGQAAAAVRSGLELKAKHQ